MENNIKKAANTLEKETENTSARMGTAAQDVLETGRDAWNELRDRGRTMWRQTRNQSGEAMKEAEAIVRQYPARAVGAALLAGVVIGLLLTYRSED